MGFQPGNPGGPGRPRLDEDDGIKRGKKHSLSDLVDEGFVEWQILDRSSAQAIADSREIIRKRAEAADSAKTTSMASPVESCLPSEAYDCIVSTSPEILSAVEQAMRESQNPGKK